jgi:hypothetical protein
LPIAFVGFLALIVDGLAYLGIGTDAPFGWAGVWAIVISLVSISLLPWLTLSLLRGLEPEALHSSRLARLSAIVTRDVDRDIIQRSAITILQEKCESEGWEFRPLFGTPDRANVAPELCQLVEEQDATVHEGSDMYLDRLLVVAQPR